MPKTVQIRQQEGQKVTQIQQEPFIESDFVQSLTPPQASFQKFLG